MKFIQMNNGCVDDIYTLCVYCNISMNYFAGAIQQRTDVKIIYWEANTKKLEKIYRAKEHFRIISCLVYFLFFFRLHVLFRSFGIVSYDGTRIFPSAFVIRGRFGVNRIYC